MLRGRLKVLVTHFYYREGDLRDWFLLKKIAISWNDSHLCEKKKGKRAKAHTNVRTEEFGRY